MDKLSLKKFIVNHTGLLHQNQPSDSRQILANKKVYFIEINLKW